MAPSAGLLTLAHLLETARFSRQQFKTDQVDAMKINGNAIRPGNIIEHQGRLWRAVKTQHVKPGKGGAKLDA